MDAGGPAQGGALGAGQGSTSASGPAGGQGEDLYTLEAEITELQRENARVESQVMRLRSEVNAMENHLKHGEKVNFFFLLTVGNLSAFLDIVIITRVVFPGNDEHRPEEQPSDGLLPVAAR